MKREEALEKLAEVFHDAWMHWSKSVAPEVKEERRKRWEGFWVPYDQLDEPTKNLDREWAEEALKALPELLEEKPESTESATICAVTYPTLAGILKGNA